MTLWHIPSDSRYGDPGTESQVVVLLLLLALVSDGKNVKAENFVISWENDYSFSHEITKFFYEYIYIKKEVSLPHPVYEEYKRNNVMQKHKR
jgi:hypothetical protein